MNELKIAAVCMHSEPGDMERNLKKTEAFVAEAAESGVDMVCFPELSLTGYMLNNPARIYGKFPQKDLVLRVKKMAKDYGLTVISGFIEQREGEKPYITQMVAGPDSLLGYYRKTHLSPQEKNSFQPGAEITLFHFNGMRFGIQLCYESHFPEISRVMALRGADFIIIPHASPRGTPEGKKQSWLRHLPSRAFDNALFIVAYNQVGKTKEGLAFPGVALALDPSGRLIKSHGGWEEALVLLTLRMEELNQVRLHKMKYFIPNRRPALYHDIVK